MNDSPLTARKDRQLWFQYQPQGFKVTVVDGEKPSLAQPADIVTKADPGTETAAVTFPLPAAQDNCPGVTVACLPPSGSTFRRGVTTVTCTATDTSNNKDTPNARTFDPMIGVNPPGSRYP